MFLRFTFLGLSTLEKFKITPEQIIQTVKGHGNYLLMVTKYFLLTSPVFSCGSMEKMIFPTSNFFLEKYFLQFVQVQHLNEISDQNNFLGLRKNRR